MDILIVFLFYVYVLIGTGCGLAYTQNVDEPRTFVSVLRNMMLFLFMWPLFISYAIGLRLFDK